MPLKKSQAIGLGILVIGLTGAVGFGLYQLLGPNGERNKQKLRRWIKDSRPVLDPILSAGLAWLAGKHPELAEIIPAIRPVRRFPRSKPREQIGR